MFRQSLVCRLVAVLCLTGTIQIQAADWARFRGPNGSGVTAEAAPTTWGPDKNIAWKLELPGRGVSSPIVVGNKVFVTCYSGYGIPGQDGEMEDLKRHLVCVDRKAGTVLWTASVLAELPEDEYSGAGVPAHGYASHTPVSDGERVYVFFGKTGILAYDLEGKELWRKNLGMESGRMRWGSAASPILYENLVIVNASDESESLVGLDKVTGEQKWIAAAAGLANTWGTPILAEVNGATEIVIAVPHEIWGFNPATGKLKWYAPGTNDDSMSASAVAADGVIYAFGGRGGNSVAVKAGGKGEVAALWEGQASGRFASPIAYQGKLYVNNGPVVAVYDAATGERTNQIRLGGGDVPAEEPRPAGGGFGGPGGGGFGRGGRGGSDYASPIIANGKLYFTLKAGQFHVVDTNADLTTIATNDLSSSDKSGFDATPAVSDGQLFLRSHSFLYCIAE